MSYSVNGYVKPSIGNLGNNVQKGNVDKSYISYDVTANNISNAAAQNKPGETENLNFTEVLDVSGGVSTKNSKSPAGINYDQMNADGYTAQGYSTYGDKVIISGYSKTGDKSRVYIYDSKTGELSNVIVLDNKSHVGGLSVDENGILFITKSGGKIETYDLKGLQKDYGNTGVIDFSTGKYDNYKIPNDINTGESEATLYCYDGKVYTATYGFKGTLKEVSYSYENGKITSHTKVLSNNIASTIQGLSIYKDKNGQEYLVAASSSEHIGSRIRVYEMNNDGLKRVASYNTKLEGLEGIKTDAQGNITGICEYGEQKVSDLGNVSDYVEMIKKSHISFLNNDFLFTMSGYIWDARHNS